jgi:hypothetical protein
MTLPYITPFEETDRRSWNTFFALSVEKVVGMKVDSLAHATSRRGTFQTLLEGSQKLGLGRLCDYLCEGFLVDSEGHHTVVKSSLGWTAIAGHLWMAM